MGYLENEGSGPDGDEHATAVKAAEHVRWSVNLASIDLVEQSHHHQNVKDERVMLCRSAQKLVVSAAVNVQKLVSCNLQTVAS